MESLPRPGRPARTADVAMSITPVLNLLRGRPILAIFEICLRCNSACGYCDLPLNLGRYEMTREEIRRVFRHLHEEGVRFVFIQGGEPLLRRDLADILGDLVDIGLRPTLITNGTRLTAGLVDRLAQLGIDISVSLDTLDRSRYRRIRGADQLAQVLAGLELLADYPHPRYVTCIVTQVNRDDAPEVARFARARGFIPVIGAYHWDIERYGRSDPALQYDRRAVVGVFQEILNMGVIPRGYFTDYVEHSIRWVRGERLEPCDAGRYSVAIDASGNVAPCLALPHAGNLLQMSLPEILDRLDRQKIRACSDRSGCNLLCSRVVGSLLRHPVSAFLTPAKVSEQRGSHDRPPR